MDSEPSWLNKEFLEDVLRKDDYPHAVVTDYEVRRAVGKGDNYASLMNRVTVRFKDNENDKDLHRECFLIVKSFPTNEVMAEFIQQARLFDKEIHIYQVTFPAIEEMMSELQPGSRMKPFTPKCFLTSKPNTLVLEDLAQKGFKMANRRDCLDLTHCSLALRALARFHALTVALQKRNPEMIAFYTESMYTESARAMSEKFVNMTFNTLASIVEEWIGYEEFGEKIRNLSSDSYDKMIEIVKAKKFNVLNHGDFWVNNMLFKYSDATNQVEDIRLIDFQVCRYSSPSLDLLYFMYTSPSSDVRENHMDELLEQYHTVLCDNLSSLNIDFSYTLEDLKVDMEENILFGIYTACTVLSAVVADPDNAIDVDSMTKENVEKGEINPMEKPYRGAKFKEVFQRVLLHFRNKGYL